VFLPVIVLIYALYLVIVLPLVAIGACAACALGIPVTYLVVLIRVLVSRPAWLPDQKHWPHAPAESDPAVLHYSYGVSFYGLYSPAVADVVQTVRIAYDDSRTIWGNGVNAALTSLARRQPEIATPLRAAGAAGMGVGIVFGAFVAACCALIHILVTGLCAVLWRILAAVLNGASSAFIGTQACPSCSAQVRRPLYRCTGRGCKREHRDLRPGRFGVLRRHCHCGMSMGTLPFFGSLRPSAVCPHCDRALEQGLGDTPEVLLPFFGATDEVRNRQMLSIIEQLRAWDIEGKLSVVSDGSGTVGEPDATSRRVPQPRHAYSVRLITDNDARVLYVFDTTDDITHGPGYLGRVRTCVLVIDPLSLDSFWARLPSARQAELGRERSSTPSPGIDHGNTLNRIKTMGIETQDARLAVVFARGHLVNSPERKVVRWARRELGLGDLVSSVRRDFKESRFFCADAVRGDGTSLLRWLLIGEGVAPARNRVVVDLRDEQERSYRWHRRSIFAAVLAVVITMLVLLFAL
jgi:hypothetical protein